MKIKGGFSSKNRRFTSKENRRSEKPERAQGTLELLRTLQEAARSRADGEQWGHTAKVF